MLTVESVSTPELYLHVDRTKGQQRIRIAL
jgi:hypothetical protein